MAMATISNMPVPLLRPRPECRLRASSSVSRASAAVAPSTSSDQLQLMEPDYYTMGYYRHVRAYGVHFKEGPQGVGLYAAMDMTNIERSRLILEVPMEILITVSKDPPWMFFPDIVPLGHPIFDVINATEPEEYDIRLACLLLLALEQEGNFWRIYGDYLPNKHESTDLLLATDQEIVELQDSVLTQRVIEERLNAEAIWEKSFPPSAPLKLKRLAPDVEIFKWAVGIARSRSFRLTMTIGSKVQVADIIAPYADMINHSFEPTCDLRWRESDRVLEVVVRVGQNIRAGDEMTLNYLPRKCNRDYVHKYGFSSPANPWGVIPLSGRSSSKIHRESFYSAFNIRGMPPSIYHSKKAPTAGEDPGVALAAARMLPLWSEEDLPLLPSKEVNAVKQLQQECSQLLNEYPTTYEQDAKHYASLEEASTRLKVALKYRMDEKDFIKRVHRTLDMYLDRILY